MYCFCAAGYIVSSGGSLDQHMWAVFRALIFSPRQVGLQAAGITSQHSAEDGVAVCRLAMAQTQAMAQQEPRGRAMGLAMQTPQGMAQYRQVKLMGGLLSMALPARRAMGALQGMIRVATAHRQAMGALWLLAPRPLAP